VRISVANTGMPQMPDLKGSIVMALNETANEAREKAIEVVAGKYNVKPFAVRSTVGITYASAQNLIAYLKFIGKRMALIQFSPVQTRTGVTAQIEKGKNKNYKHAFIRKSKSGKLNVFIRIEAMSASARSQAQKRKPRWLSSSQRNNPSPDEHGYPITTIKGISIPDMLSKAAVKAKVIEFIASQLPKSMEKFFKP
jgi:hypothetical protein